MKSPRDHYHVLHVHPDADREIIKASYRTLMQKLKYHPDLGGDEEHAALINLAFSVLSDPQKRAQYDLGLAKLKEKPVANKPARRKNKNQTATPETPNAAAKEDPIKAFRPRPEVNKGSLKKANIYKNFSQNTYVSVQAVNRSSGKEKTICAFCKEVNYLDTQADPQQFMICVNCHSPLKFVNFDPAWVSERGANRIKQTTNIQFIPNSPGARSHRGTVEDLSPTGMRFQSSHPLKMGNIIKIDNDELSAVASVMRCDQKTLTNYSSGVKFLTLKLNAPRGTFISHKV